MFRLLLIVFLSISFVDSRSHQLLNSDYQKQREIKQNLRNALRGGYSLIVDEAGDRLVEIVPNGLCYIYANRLSVSKIVKEHPESVWVAPDNVMKTVINTCSEFMVKNLELYSSSSNFGNKLFEPIFPAMKAPEEMNNHVSYHDREFFGTKWCGDGSTAEDYEDLGMFEETDMCCRTHDHCPEGIKAEETKHNLTNDYGYTISHCDCDNAFSSCLLASDDSAADMILWVFFQVLGGVCFKQDYPVIGCNEWDGLFNMYCSDYELDKTQPKTYQFFENPTYGETRKLLDSKVCPAGRAGKLCRRKKNEIINKKQQFLRHLRAVKDGLLFKK